MTKYIEGWASSMNTDEIIATTVEELREIVEDNFEDEELYEEWLEKAFSKAELARMMVEDEFSESDIADKFWDTIKQRTNVGDYVWVKIPVPDSVEESKDGSEKTD